MERGLGRWTREGRAFGSRLCARTGSAQKGSGGRDGGDRLTENQRGAGRGSWGKGGEGTSQRARMNDPGTWTAVWGLTVGAGESWAEENKGGKLGQL